MNPAADCIEVALVASQNSRHAISQVRSQWHLLKPKSWPVYSKSLMRPESDYGLIIGERFSECLGGYAACGLLRKNLPQSSDLSHSE